MLVQQRQPDRAFTLIETTIASLIIGVMLVAAINTMGFAVRTRQAASTSQIGGSLAHELLTEIMRQPYQDPTAGGATIGRDPGEGGHNSNRDRCDDVDDYDGIDNNTPEWPDGTNRPEYLSWRRQVSVQFVDPTNPSSVVPTDMGLKRITVTVTDPNGKSVVREGFRSSAGPADTDIGFERTYTSWLGVELQIGPSDASRYAGGTALLNEAN